MKKITVFALLAIALAFGASALAAQTFGKGVSLETPTKVSEIVAAPHNYQGKPVMVEGTIVNVCRSRGCWVDISSDTPFQTFRIKVDDGVIVFPPSLKGSKVKVEGAVEIVRSRCGDKPGEPCAEKKGHFIQLRATGATVL